MPAGTFGSSDEGRKPLVKRDVRVFENRVDSNARASVALVQSFAPMRARSFLGRGILVPNVPLSIDIPPRLPDAVPI